MTQIWLVSDLHQEHAVNSYDLAAHAPPSFDVLVVAGDVTTPGDRAINWLADRFPGVPLVYVLGNHDLWLDYDDPSRRYTYLDMYAEAQNVAARRGVSLLVDSAVSLAGVRFLGGTLWTSMTWPGVDPGHCRNTARRIMNDYRFIRRRTSGRHRHLEVAETMAMHVATRDYIDSELSAPFDGPSVVVTHHAPTHRSLDDPYMADRWAYASDLSSLIDRRQPDAWVHGHLHNHADYTIGRTRVVANPRGHVSEATRAQFQPSMVVTVPTGTDWAMAEMYRLHGDLEGSS